MPKKPSKSAKPSKPAKKEKMPVVETSDIDVSEKVREGWIHTNSIIEMLAASKEVVEQTLKDHVEKIAAERGVIVVKKSFSTVEKMENPPKGLKEAYSQFVELEILFRNYSMIVYYVFTYGPSGTEIIEPRTITLGQGEAQDIANAMASMMHQLAAAGVGGIVVSRKQQMQ